MSEKPKPGGEIDEEETETLPDRETWGEDQKKHRYYYDDAHGYESYDPDEEENDEEED
jgi:hypothetical protein